MSQVLSFNHNPKQLDMETASFSSSSSSPKRHSITELELYENLRKQLEKNEGKLKQILKENPAFRAEIYRPRLQDRREGASIELLAKKLDRLMEDECLLDKQLSKISFLQQENEEWKQVECSNSIKNISKLREAWQKPIECENGLDKIDQLNLRVATIKNYVKVLTRKQNHHQSVQLQKYVLESKEYLQLKDKCERQAAQIVQKQGFYTAKIAQLECEVERLKNSNNYAHAEEERLKKKDEEILRLMHKNQVLQLQIIKKEKELKNTLKQNVKHSPEASVKCIRFTDRLKNLIITVESSLVESSMQFTTAKTYHEIKSFLLNLNPLESLIEGRASPNIAPLSVSSPCSAEQRERRRNVLDRNDVNRSELMLGSQDKKKRFERTKLVEQ